MKRNPLFAILVLALAYACGNTTAQKNDVQTGDSTATETVVGTDSKATEAVVETDSVGDEDGFPDKSLNDIRFADFKENKDWIDNEYVRTLRKHIDDYYAGKVKDEALDGLKDKMHGQFAILSTEPFIGGGLMIHYIFVDNADDVFTTVVYSDVDRKTEKVTGYHVQHTMLEDEKSGATKEDILKAVSEQPDLRLW